jgi:hypothetical protein
MNPNQTQPPELTQKVKTGSVKNGKILVNFWLDLPTYYRLRKLPDNRSQFLRSAINTALPKFEAEAKEYYQTLNLD